MGTLTIPEQEKRENSVSLFGKGSGSLNGLPALFGQTTTIPFNTTLMGYLGFQCTASSSGF